MDDEKLTTLESLPRKPARAFVKNIEKLLLDEDFRQEVWVDFRSGDSTRRYIGSATDLENCEPCDVRPNLRWRIGFLQHDNQWGIYLCEHELFSQRIRRLIHDHAALSFSEEYLDAFIDELVFRFRWKNMNRESP